MKNLIKRLTRKFSIFFYTYLFPKWKEGYQEFVYEKFKKEIEYSGDGFSMKELPAYTMPRMIKISGYVEIGKGVSLESEGGIIIGDDVTLDDGCVIETIDKSPLAGKKWNHPHRMLPAVLGKNVYVGRKAIIPPGSIVPKGTVIPAGETYGSKPASAYDTRWPERNWLGLDHVPAASLEEQMFFVVSTGRSGTQTIATVLSKHSKIECKHEAHFPLNNLSSLHVEGLWEEEKVKSVLKALYVDHQPIPVGTSPYGESDLKNSPLISLLHEVLPKARFIWLIRRAEDFVASAYGRGWFDPEKDGEIESQAPQKEEASYMWPYVRHRVEGGLADPSLGQEKWKEMSAFERNCWYWSFWNQMIEDQLKELPENQHFFLRLEELEEQLPKLQSWLGTEVEQLQTGIFNKAKHPKIKQDSWTEEQTQLFDKWCAPGMRKWYGEGKNENNAN